jgi:hypothetical protein
MAHFLPREGPLPPKQIEIRRIDGGILIAMALNDTVYQGIVGAEGEQRERIAKALGDEIADFVRALAEKEVEAMLREPAKGILNCTEEELRHGKEKAG